MLTTKSLSLKWFHDSRSSSRVPHRPGAQLLKCPATPRLHEHHDKGEEGEPDQRSVPAANAKQTRASFSPAPPPAPRAETTTPPSRVRALISHWEAVTQGQPSGAAVSELVNAELEQMPREGQAQPSQRALAMAASMGDAKRQASSRSGSTAGAVNSGSSSSTSTSDAPEASTREDVSVPPQGSLRYSGPMTIGKRQMLNHLQVLDSLNHAYSARSAELRARKSRTSTTPEGIKAADWVLQVLGYKMDDQALEGWEARVLEGAARAGVPLEEVLGTEAVDRYKASLLDRMPQTPPQPPLPLPPQQPGSKGMLAAPPTSPKGATAPTNDAKPSTGDPPAPTIGGGTTLPKDDAVAPVDDVEAPKDDAMSPADAVTPSRNAVTAPVEDEATPPAHAAIPPANDVAAPAADDAPTLPAFPPTAPLPRPPPGTGPYMTTPYGDVVPEESGLLLQQLTLGALAVATTALAPLGAAASGIGVVAKGMGRLVDVCALLGKLCVTAVFVAQSKLPLLPPSKYTPGPQDPTPHLPPSLDPSLGTDPLRQLLGQQPIGHFKQPMASSKYAPKLSEVAGSAATPEGDALRLLLAGKPIGHFKRPMASSKYAPRLFDTAAVPPSLDPSLGSDPLRQLLGQQPIGHFRQPMASSKYAPRLPTQWGVEQEEAEDLTLPLPPPQLPPDSPTLPCANVQEARDWIARFQSRLAGAVATAAAPSNVQEARDWIARFQSRQATAAPPASAAPVPLNVQEARDWIARFMSTQAGASAPAASLASGAVAVEADEENASPMSTAARCAATLAAAAAEGSAAAAKQAIAAARRGDTAALMMSVSDAAMLAAAAAEDAVSAAEAARMAGGAGSVAAASAQAYADAAKASAEEAAAAAQQQAAAAAAGEQQPPAGAAAAQQPQQQQVAPTAAAAPAPRPSRTRKKVYKGDPIRQILAGTAPPVPAPTIAPVVSRKYAPALPTSWGPAASAAKQSTSTTSPQVLPRLAPATAAAPTAPAVSSSSSSSSGSTLDSHGASILHKYVPRAPTHWGQAASGVKEERAGQRGSGRSPVRLLLDFLSSRGAQKEATPAKAAGPPAGSKVQAPRSDVATSRASSGNSSSTSVVDSLSGPTDSLPSPASSLTGQAAGVAAAGPSSSSSSSSSSRHRNPHHPQLQRHHHLPQPLPLPP